MSSMTMFAYAQALVEMACVPSATNKTYVEFSDNGNNGVTSFAFNFTCDLSHVPSSWNCDTAPLNTTLSFFWNHFFRCRYEINDFKRYKAWVSDMSVNTCFGPPHTPPPHHELALNLQMNDAYYFDCHTNMI